MAGFFVIGLSLFSLSGLFHGVSPSCRRLCVSRRRRPARHHGSYYIVRVRVVDDVKGSA
jgi:hypothetical protein